MVETRSSGAGASAPAPPTQARVPHGFAVRVLPVGSGGHWADVIAVRGGRTGIVLGRCPDPTAAAALRARVRDALRHSGDPVRSLGRIEDRTAAAICAVIDATTIRYRTCGDSPPTVVPSDAAGVVRLVPGATVVLSTSSAAAGAADHIAGDSGLHPDELADRIVTADGNRGPIAVVVYRHPPEPITLTLPAVPANLAVFRERLREWLSRVGVGPEASADVLLAIGEATANAAEHSVVGSEGPVTLSVSVAMTGNRLSLRVSDDGRWKPAAVARGYRGHGMHLINALVDSVELTATPDGTTVDMTKELPMTTARFTVTAAADDQPPAVAVVGDVDLANVAQFESALAEAGASGGPLTVDLTEASYCDSAAVRALFSVAASNQLTMIVNPTGHITTLLGISGLDRVATVVRKD